MGKPTYRTMHLPVTNRHPVPSGAVLVMYPDGGGYALASRSLDKRRLHMALFHRFGNRACWPQADGRNWRVRINPPAPVAVEVAKEAA